MFKPIGIVLPFILLLISASIFFQKSVLVCGSSVKEQMLKRPDPLLNFKAYNGDYDIQNKHYWASAIYTGLHGYVMAGVWLLFGLGFAIYVIVRSLCCTSSSPLNEHSDNYYIILFTLAVLFTLLAMIAGSLAIAAEEMSISKTRRLIDTVLNAGVSARRSIQRINNVLREMEALLEPYDGNAYHILNSTRSVLETESQTIQYFVLKSNSLADEAVQLLHVANIVLAVIYLSLLLAGFVQLFMHWKPGFVIIIFFLWSLTTINWLMTGFDFFFHTFIRDTCTAFAEYNPDQNSSLGNLLPCGKTAASDKILVEVGSTIHEFVTELNSKLRILRYIFNENRREGLLGLEICDPFPIPPTNHSIAPQTCSKDVTPITDLSNVLARYTCYENNSTSYCIREGKYIPHIAFIVAWAYSKSIEELVNVYPDAQSLSQCIPLLEALSNVVTHQCKPLKASIGLLWSSMLCLSIIMLLLTLVLVAKAYQDWRRQYSLCSIIPTGA